LYQNPTEPNATILRLQKGKKPNNFLNQQSTISLTILNMLRTLQWKKSSRCYGSTTMCTVAIERDVQIDAFETHAMNKNKLRRGDMKIIITAYHERKLFCVTKQNLDYRYRLHLKGIQGLGTNNIPTTASVLQTQHRYSHHHLSAFIEYDDKVSCLTNPSSGICNDSNDESSKESNNTNNGDISGGQKKGTTVVAKTKYTLDLRKATTSVATKYIDLQN
jgi:hypothetical protein